MNLEVDNTILEDYGAGFEGTNALRDKYIKDTPGQRIQQFKTKMKQKTYQEFEAQHKKMYPSHTTDQIKAAYKKYSEYFEMEEVDLEEAKDPKQAADFQRVIYGLMKQDDYNKKWKLGKYRPAGNKLAGPGGLYKNLLMPSKKESEMEEVYGESWVVYNKDTKAKIKPFKTRKGAYEYAAKNGGVVYSGEYYHDHQDDINSGKLVKEESLQEAVPKIDVEELLDAAAKMRKEMPALRKGQSIMITLHNMNPKLYSMAVDKADAFTVDAKIPDLINFLDPKYYAESANLDEAMEPQNTSYGYYGTVDVEKYKLIAYKEMADTVLKIVRAKKIFANFPNITSNADQESAVVKYLDSKHGRHIADGNDSPAYIEKDFTKFLKDFAVGHYMESSGLEEGRFFNVRDYMATSEKSQFGGYRPHIVDKAGKTMYLSVAAYNTPDEAKDHAENYLKQYARGISEPRVPIKGTYVKEAINIRDYMATSEKSQFGGYTPIVVDKKGKVMYSGQASYNTPDEAKDHAENYLKQYARGIGEPRVPVKGTYVKESTEEISLEERRQMKIVALATGSTDLDKIYEYVTTQPVQYSSIVELKESFNKYINTP